MNNKANKTSFQKGHKPLKGAFGKGSKMPESGKEKLRKFKLGKIGILATNWQGGKSKDVHSVTSPRYKKWRMEVFIRDNFTCQGCGIRGCYLEAHHIKSWAKYPKLRYELGNGVALCESCHKLTDNYKGKSNKKYE